MAASLLMTSARALWRDEQPTPERATERAGLGDLAAIRLSPSGDGELTQDLLYRSPIERKLSDEQSSNRLDTILADRNSDCHQPHDFALPSDPGKYAASLACGLMSLSLRQRQNPAGSPRPAQRRISVRRRAAR